MMAERTNGKFQAQTVMIIAKVIEAASDIHVSYYSNPLTIIQSRLKYISRKTFNSS
jgi:hypothetical protein